MNNDIETAQKIFKEVFLDKCNMKEIINNLVIDIHTKNIEAGWWNDSKTGKPLLGEWYTPYVIGTKIWLIGTELAEATEGYRKDKFDDKLPDRPMIEVELADAFIRLCDIAGALNIDLGGAIEEKRKFNISRPDHQVENRQKEGGKKF